MFKDFTIKKLIQDITIFIIFISGIVDILSTIPLVKRSVISKIERLDVLNLSSIANLHGTVMFIIGIIIIFITSRLYKRLRVAWLMAIIILPLSYYLQIQRHVSDLFSVFSFVNLFVFMVMLLSYKDFSRSSNPITIKYGITFALISIAIVVVNTTAGFFILRHHFPHIKNLSDAFLYSLNLFFSFNVSEIGIHSKIATFYVDFAFTLYWAGILLACLFTLTPLIYQPVVTIFDRNKVRDLVNLYSQNPLSYVFVEDDKKYFFAKTVEGVIAFNIVAGVIVCVGDPICKEEDMGVLLGEFLVYCKSNDLEILFCETTDKFLEIYKSMGFHNIKYGEEAMFYLPEYTLTGRKKVNLRNAINRATGEGIEVVEYKPLEKRDAGLESQIDDVSKEWLESKKNSELSFMIGTIGLKNPMDKRYFLAIDPQGVVQGFVVFYPYLEKKGYYADITRRRNTAPVGVMEKIMTSAFEQMKQEGILWCSMGIAPLANVGNDPEQGSIYEKILAYFYENMNSFYGFKSLHFYKLKYVPTHWHMCYLVYYKQFTPKMAYALVKAQNPKGVSDYLLTQVKQIFSSENKASKQ